MTDDGDDSISPLKPIRDNLCLLKSIAFPLKVRKSLRIISKIKLFILTFQFQFTNSAATKLARKRCSGAMFLAGAAIPGTAVTVFIMFSYMNNVDFMDLMKLMIQFSPLTTMDLCSNWGYVASYYVVHYSLYRGYSGMEEKLTQFAQIYVGAMEGAVSKGTLLIQSGAVYRSQGFEDNVFGSSTNLLGQ